MKITQMIRLLEEADETKIHVLGDSHAVAMASSITGAVNSAKNGAGMNAVASTAQAVPDNSRVVLSVGNNNVAQPAGADRGLINILKSLTDRGCKVVYVGFPAIDLDSEKPSTLANNGQKNENRIVVKISNEDDTSEMTAAELAEFRAQQAAQTDPALKLSVQVPARLPLKYVYRNAGYTEEYNNLRGQLMNVADPMQGVSVVALTNDDVNPADPMGIHATPNAYARVADEAVRELGDGAQDTTATDDDQVIDVADQLSDEEFQAIDLDGNGEVTMGEYNQYAADNNIDLDGFDIPSSVSNGLESVFGILLDYANRTTGENMSLDQLRDTVMAGEGYQSPPREIGGDAQLGTTSGSAAENALILEARRKWQNVQDREIWICALIAQCRVETANFTLNTEVWGPTATQLTYDIKGPRPAKARSLGNTEPGDGFKYRGRGWIQLTGKANYQAAQSIAGADIVNNPDLAARPAVANKTAIHYFETRVMNKTQARNIQQISRLVNGGNNGMAQRIAAFEQLMDNLSGQDPITGSALARGTDSGSLRYENQGKIRGGKLDSRLEAMLQKAAEEVGVVVHISSGGQMGRDEAIAAGAREGRDSRGSGGKAWILNGESVRTGSTRHDNGMAGDVQVSSGGVKQSLTSPIMKSFITAFFSQPGAGGGAGAPGYMGNYTVHVDIHTNRTRSWNNSVITAAQQAGYNARSSGTRTA